MHIKFIKKDSSSRIKSFNYIARKPKDGEQSLDELIQAHLESHRKSDAH